MRVSGPALAARYPLAGMTRFDELPLHAVFLFADERQTRIYMKTGVDRAHCPDATDHAAHRIRIAVDVPVIPLRRLNSAPSGRFGRHG